MSQAPDGSLHLDVPDWMPAWSASRPSYVRISSSHLRGYGCPEQIARKARPDAFPDERGPWEPKGVGSFPLGLVRDALLILLTRPRQEAPDGQEAPDPVTTAIEAAVEESWDEWAEESLPAVRAGVSGYLQTLESLRADGTLADGLVFPDLAVIQDPEGDRVEMWSWAIHHVSLDGSAREVHVLRWRDARQARLADGEAAFFAHTAGSGIIAEHAKWYRSFEPVHKAKQPPPARVVRVRVVGLLDATSDVRWEGTPDQAAAEVAEKIPVRLGVLAGGTRPSRSCADCSIRHVCPGLPRMPGLLGVAGYSPRTRAVSPSDLWTHRACPRQLHLLRDLGLPRTPTESGPALRRGTQVHAWLAAAHARGVACSAADLPDDRAESRFAVQLGWTDDEYATNLPFLRQHLHSCPLRDPDVSEVLAEVDVTVWDTDANVVLSTRPDAAWQRPDGGWVLRETKTFSPRGLPEDRTRLLERFAQVAAAICLLADGYTPDGQPSETAGVVELELLGSDRGEVIEFDASDPLVVLVARTCLADRIDTWLFDESHPVGAQPPCGSCEVAEWCEVKPASAIEQVTAELLPTIAAGDHDWAVPDALLAQDGLAESVEEFPF